ncbi:MAG: hypothetical protein LAO56_18490 [Acidobacteriia bacterium]|jgi:hypothetical protein|nr:hypothetical protein [Terriglobia bacterium]
MADIDKEIAQSCLHDLIVWVFGRDREADGDTGLGSDGTSSDVEYPENWTSAGEAK